MKKDEKMINHQGLVLIQGDDEKKKKKMQQNKRTAREQRQTPDSEQNGRQKYF